MKPAARLEWIFSNWLLVIIVSKDVVVAPRLPEEILDLVKGRENQNLIQSTAVSNQDHEYPIHHLEAWHDYAHFPDPNFSPQLPPQEYPSQHLLPDHTYASSQNNVHFVEHFDRPHHLLPPPSPFIQYHEQQQEPLRNEADVSMADILALLAHQDTLQAHPPSLAPVPTFNTWHDSVPPTSTYTPLPQPEAIWNAEPLGAPWTEHTRPDPNFRTYGNQVGATESNPGLSQSAMDQQLYHHQGHELSGQSNAGLMSRFSRPAALDQHLIPIEYFRNTPNLPPAHNSGFESAFRGSSPEYQVSGGSSQSLSSQYRGHFRITQSRISPEGVREVGSAGVEIDPVTNAAAISPEQPSEYRFEDIDARRGLQSVKSFIDEGTRQVSDQASGSGIASGKVNLQHKATASGVGPLKASENLPDLGNPRVRASLRAKKFPPRKTTKLGEKTVKFDSLVYRYATEENLAQKTRATELSGKIVNFHEFNRSLMGWKVSKSSSFGLKPFFADKNYHYILVDSATLVHYFKQVIPPEDVEKMRDGTVTIIKVSNGGLPAWQVHSLFGILKPEVLEPEWWWQKSH